MSEQPDVRVVFITAPNLECAETLARKLVEERLAACVNVVPGIRSIYRWKETIEDEREALMILKTRTDLFQNVEQRVKELHPYEVPEIVSVPLTHGSREYLDWLSDCT